MFISIHPYHQFISYCYHCNYIIIFHYFSPTNKGYSYQNNPWGYIVVLSFSHSIVSICIYIVFHICQGYSLHMEKKNKSINLRFVFWWRMSLLYAGYNASLFKLMAVICIHWHDVQIKLIKYGAKQITFIDFILLFLLILF